MFWKKWPYWLKLGIIFTIINLAFYFSSLVCWQDCTSRGALTNVCLKCPIAPGQLLVLYLLDLLPHKYQVAINVSSVLSNIFRYLGFIGPFIIGAILGFVYNKVRDKNIISNNYFYWLIVVVILIAVLLSLLKL